ncbi:unnamed protein product [Gadus morhua 'NCC']
MDPTSQFFSKLRRLAVTLETETESLLGAYKTRDEHCDDESATERGMGAYHTLCNELADLKGEIRVRLEQQLTREEEVKRYLAACGVMQRRITNDINTLKGHYESYGYKAPPQTHTQVKGHLPESADLGVEEGSASVKEEEDGATERKDPHLPSTPQSTQPPSFDALRTPKLADFGLSELALKGMLSLAHREDVMVPKSLQVPVLSFPPPQSSLAMPPAPTLLMTPKCLSRTEKEVLPTPQMKDFGISERTLHPDSDPVATGAPPPATYQMRTPKPSDFGLSDADLQRIGAMGYHEALPMPALSFTSLQSSLAPPLSPGVPLTPRRELHMEEEEEEEEEEELRTKMKDFGLVEHTLCLNNDFTMDLHRMAKISSKQKQPQMVNLTLEMPKMESVFCNTLIQRRACESGDPSSLDVDGTTQEFNLRTPRVRLDYQDPSTPEMPDLSFITQDICKLVSRADLKEKNTAVIMPTLRGLGKENGVVLLAPVGDSEFRLLPNYLRQMSLRSLNDFLHKINTAAAAKHRQGEALQFQIEELMSFTGVGTMAHPSVNLNLGVGCPTYLLCLEELHRLKHVQRVGKSSVYKLLPKH